MHAPNVIADQQKESYIHWSSAQKAPMTNTPGKPDGRQIDSSIFS